MDIYSNIYYLPQNNALYITSNFAEIKERMDRGIDPLIEYRKISIADFNHLNIENIGFDKIDDSYFQGIKHIFSKLKFETLAFHQTNVDLSGVMINVKHLIIGENCKINLTENNFIDIEEITFLSLKTFKGKILSKIETVKKITIWFENKKSNEIISLLPNLKEFYIYNGSVVV